MTGYLELNSRRGRLYYRPSGQPPPIGEVPSSYLRSRPSRQQLIPFSLRSVDFRIPDPSSKRNWEELAGDILVKSKDQAKRLLHNWLSPATESPSSISRRRHTSSDLLCRAAMTSGDAARRGSARTGSIIGGPVSGMVHRPSLVQELRRDSATSTSSSGSGAITIPNIGEEKPIASGNGVSLSIALAEPVLFLQGMDQSELGNQTTTMLRGTFHLRVSKSAKIKTITLAFRGRAETEWPEGESPSRNCQHFENRPNQVQAFHRGRPSSRTGKAS